MLPRHRMTACPTQPQSCPQREGPVRAAAAGVHHGQEEGARLWRRGALQPHPQGARQGGARPAAPAHARACASSAAPRCASRSRACQMCRGGVPRRAWAARAGLRRLAAARARACAPEPGRTQPRAAASARAGAGARASAVRPRPGARLQRGAARGCKKGRRGAAGAVRQAHPGAAAGLRRAPGAPRRAPCRDTKGDRPAAPASACTHGLVLCARARARATASASGRACGSSVHHPASGARAAGLTVVAAYHCGVHRQPLKPCPLQELWPGLVERHGGHLAPEFDLSTLASLSEGYASGTIEQARATHHPSELLSTLCSVSDEH